MPGDCRRPTPAYADCPEEHEAWVRCELAGLFNHYLGLIENRNAIAHWEKNPRLADYFKTTMKREASQLVVVLKKYGYQFCPGYDPLLAQPGDGAIFEELITKTAR